MNTKDFDTLYDEDSPLMINDKQRDFTPVTVTWKDISYTIKVKVSKNPFNGARKKKKILQNINGFCKPGQILAIMGSSGAGKSSLLDVLADRKPSKNLTGQLLVNGKPITKKYKRISGYVTQDDCIVGNLTVKENLMFYANLQLPNSISKEQKEKRVKDIIEELGLTGVTNERVGTQFRRGISGGEKKRLSIGCQMITDPGLLFLDEPTTGLDAYNSQNVLECLHTLANDGRTIICTIHQPRSTIFELFDQLCLLSDGHCVYFGRADQALDYFAEYGFTCSKFINPLDFFIDLIIENLEYTKGRDGTPPSYRTILANQENILEEEEKMQRVRNSKFNFDDIDLITSYETSELNANIIDSIEHINSDFQRESQRAYYDKADSNLKEYASNWFTQFHYVAKRQTINLIRNPMVTYAQLFQTLFMAFLVSSIYFQIGDDQGSVQDRVGCLFFIITNQAFGSISSLNLFLEERNLVNRERASGTYMTTAYYFSKVIVESPVLFLFPLMFGSIVYFSVGLINGLDHFLIFIACLIIFAATAQSVFLVIGALSPNAVFAQVLAPVVTVLFLLFGGFYVNNNNIPWYYSWIHYLSFFKYGFNILCVNEFEDLNICNKVNGVKVCTPGSQELELLGMVSIK
eukprot:TRINITY_DN200_c0_g1_i3.p1 TRINITY_DN200_c0_g1~~TRINITY_DN200_c0_g1_i3.p1  ORF type:complete len:633 (+),score=155.33 TRINITY_DN200_c0_g1_i3:30-1928(+)